MKFLILSVEEVIINTIDTIIKGNIDENVEIEM